MVSVKLSSSELFASLEFAASNLSSSESLVDRDSYNAMIDFTTLTSHIPYAPSGVQINYYAK